MDKQQNISKDIPKSVQMRRICVFLALFTIIWLALAGRLYYLQVAKHDVLSAAAVSQYQVMVEGLDTRGNILDRNLEPLTGRVQQYYYFLEKSRMDGKAEELLGAVSARLVSAGSPNRTYAVYRTELFDEGINRQLRETYGAYVFAGPSRYSDEQLACHLVGYLNQSEKTGVSGLEKAYEPVLQAGSGQLALWADGKGSLLLNVSPRLEGGAQMKDGSLTVTLDSSLQRISQEAMEESGLRGAVLVSDATTGQILAWTSAPDFNPNAVADYLKTGSDNLVNKCIQGTYPPGSVFKIAVAAAALEAGIDPQEVYMCEGQTEAGGVILGCQSGPEGGHGEVAMYEAMAVSCNCYFAELGERLGTERILEMAGRLGFGRKVFSQFSEELSGNLPEMAGEWDVSNLSIGQGQLLATPVQVHRMMSIVACGGLEVPLTVVLSEPSSSASSALPESGGGEIRRILPEETARRLSDMLSLVMWEGTGSGTMWTCPVYGKTGTAESLRNGSNVNYCWFSGFCDVDSRRYVVTVLVEDGASGAASALPLFREIAEYLQVRGQLSFR